MSYQLEGKSVIVTGAGSGIGRATAMAFGREGALVIAVDLTGGGAEAVAEQINAQGGRAFAFDADVANGDQVAQVVENTLRVAGTLDCAFNNAGIAAAHVNAGGAKLGDLTREAWDKLIDVNLTGVWLCMKSQLLQMSKQPAGGVIVNASSIAGIVGLPGSNAYVGSKHGVIGLTRSAAVDYGPSGIRVNAICPGYVQTPLVEEAFARRGEQILSSVPLRRLGTPEEIAESVLWLCSPRSGFITGAVIAVDGGYTAA